jgi:hypothetical protein
MPYAKIAFILQPDFLCQSIDEAKPHGGPRRETLGDWRLPETMRPVGLKCSTHFAKRFCEKDSSVKYHLRSGRNLEIEVA